MTSSGCPTSCKIPKTSWKAVLAVVALSATQAFATGTFSMVAAPTRGTPNASGPGYVAPGPISSTLSPNDTIAVPAGVIVQLEIHITWDDGDPGRLLGVAGWKIDGATTPQCTACGAGTIGYDNGVGTPLEPLGSSSGDFSFGAYFNTNRCLFSDREGGSDNGFDPPCNAADPNDGPQAPAPEFAMSLQVPASDVFAASVDSHNYEFLLLSQSGGNDSNNGLRYYGSTLRLDVPVGASGTYEIGFVVDPLLTFMADDNFVEIPITAYNSAFINVVEPKTPSLATTYPHGALKNKYISFVPDPASAVSAGGLLHGYQVTHVDSGDAWFISAPRRLPASVIGQNLTYLVGDATPPLHDFGTLSEVHVGGCIIATGETYEVRATIDGANFSAPLVVTTADVPTNGRNWADIVGAFSVTGNVSTTPPTPANSWEPPNGSMNGFDVTATLSATQTGFKPHVSWVDVDGGPEGIPNRFVNGNDVLRVVNAFATGTGRDFYPMDHPDVGGAGCPICDPVTSGPCGTPPLLQDIFP